jgi:hypothetical protein
MQPSSFRLRAAAIHLGVSAVVIAVFAALTLLLWFPGQYRYVAGGLRLFALLAGVDAILGPTLTLVVASASKSRSEFYTDVSLIGLVQVVALAYGLHVLYVARPVALVFEVDRLRVISANQVLAHELDDPHSRYHELSLTGPVVLVARDAATADERLNAIDWAMKGFDIGQRPTFWQPYSSGRDRVWRASKPIASGASCPGSSSTLDTVLRQHHLLRGDVRVLPLDAHAQDWWVLILPKGEVGPFLYCDAAAHR